MILSSLLFVASGGNLGPEALLVNLTGFIGTWLGKIFRLKGEELRSLSIAWMASGFTALFVPLRRKFIFIRNFAL